MLFAPIRSAPVSRLPRRSLGMAALLAAALVPQTACGQPGPHAGASPSAISGDALRTRVLAFADDSMQGRRAGTSGHARAVSYIVRELARTGLRPAGDGGSYLQRVPLGSSGRDTTWSSNVVAILEGSDPALRTQFVALGAHSDHIGLRSRPIDHDSARAVNQALWERRGRVAGTATLGTSETRRVTAEVNARRGAARSRADSVYNGADDDGSGSMALLELAAYFGASRAKPRRSLLFVWHTAEEINLDGSEWFVSHPVVPLDRIVAQLNIDMIGRGSARDIAGGGDGYLSVLGPRRLSSELARWVNEVNAEQARPLTLDYSLDADGHPENIYCRSDHASYAARGIPIVFFFTNIHGDYHEVTDEAQYLDYPHYARVTSYISALVQRIANAEHAPVVDQPKPDLRAPCRQ